MSKSTLNINFEDFIPYYNDIDEVDENGKQRSAQSELTKKKEFLDYMAAEKESIPKDGEYYTHQTLFMRYLLAYDKILSIAETGTGKTGSFIAVTEFMSRHPGMLNQIYVFQNGKTTINDFTEQLNKFLKGNSRIKAYNVVTYRKFAGDIKKKYIDSRTGKYNIKDLRAHFNGSAFFVDEGHNLTGGGKTFKFDEEDSTHNITLKETYKIFHEIFHILEGCKIVVASATPMITDVNEIAKLANLILPLDKQLSENWDYNLVSMKQMDEYFSGRITYVRSFDTNVNVWYAGEHMIGRQTLDGETDFDETFEFEISVPKDQWDYTKAKKDSKGQPMPTQADMQSKFIKPDIKIYKSYMDPGSIQRKAYKKYLDKEDKIEKFDRECRSLSLFVYPNGTFKGMKTDKGEDDDTFLEENEDLDMDDIEELIKTKKATNLYKNNYITETSRNVYSIPQTFKDNLVMRRLGGLSCKYKSIIEIELENMKNSCAFVYSEFISGPGNIVLSLCFESNGFEKFDSGVNPFSASTEILYGKSYNQIKPTFPKKLRYAFVTEKTTRETLNAILNLLNCPQNVHAEYLQVIIGSKILRDGVNLVNCTREHIALPIWHRAGYYQAISRIIRPQSHVYILQELKNNNNKLNIEDRVPENDIRVNITIYNHVAIYRKFTDAEDNELSDAEIDKLGEETLTQLVEDGEIYVEEKSVDVTFYKNSEIKDANIRRFMRILKQCAFDCQLNYNRNVRTTDVDGSRECDYDICRYTCSNASTLPTLKEVDYSTHDILYSEDAIHACKHSIINYIKEVGFVNFSKIKEMYIDTQIYKELYVYLAVDKILNNKYDRIIDNFGYKCYINTDGYNFFLQEKLPVKYNIEMGIYNKLLYAVTTIKMDSVDEVGDVNHIYISKILNMPMFVFKPNWDFVDLKAKETLLFNLNALTVVKRIEIIEFYIKKLIIEVNTKNRNLDKYKDLNLAKALYSLYRNMIYKFEEPIEDIESVKKYIADKFKKQGKRAKSIQEFKPKDLILIGEPKYNNTQYNYKYNSMIYMHTLYFLEKTKSYAVNSTIKNVNIKLRIIKMNDFKNPKAIEWRDVSDYEKLAYRYIISQKQVKDKVVYESQTSYGILKDGEFRIKVPDDKKSKGMICNTLSKEKLLKIFLEEMDELIEEKLIKPEEFEDDMTTEFLISYLDKYINVDNLTREELVYLYNVNLYRRYAMCEILSKHYTKTERMDSYNPESTTFTQ